MLLVLINCGRRERETADKLPVQPWCSPAGWPGLHWRRRRLIQEGLWQIKAFVDQYLKSDHFIIEHWKLSLLKMLIFLIYTIGPTMYVQPKWLENSCVLPECSVLFCMRLAASLGSRADSGNRLQSYRCHTHYWTLLTQPRKLMIFLTRLTW